MSTGASARPRRAPIRLLKVVLWALLAVVAVIGGCNGYLMYREHRDPSGRVVLVPPKGTPIVLVPSQEEATPSVSPPPEMGGIQSRPSPTRHRAKETASQPVHPEALLPPLRITIPAIGVDDPVVLGDNEHLPQFRAVGWFMGTAYPGKKGNMVMFGHLDGPYATLGRLHELRPGSGIYVWTRQDAYVYTVVSSRIVPKEDVSVMAPTRDARLTLITCAGRWLPTERTYTHRLIVTAEYAGRRAR